MAKRKPRRSDGGNTMPNIPRGVGSDRESPSSSQAVSPATISLPDPSPSSTLDSPAACIQAPTSIPVADNTNNVIGSRLRGRILQRCDGKDNFQQPPEPGNINIRDVADSAVNMEHHSALAESSHAPKNASQPLVKRAKATATFSPGQLLGCEGLPEDTLLFIFARLGFRDLARASCVSRRWRHLGYHPQLWARLDLRFHTSFDQSMASSLSSRGSYLRSLLIRGGGPPAFATMSLLRSPASSTSPLRSLTLDSCPDLTDATLTMLAASCPSLSSLTLSSCSRLSPASLSCLAMCCPTLERLSLTGLPRADKTSLSMLARHCPSLSDLSLLDCPNVDEKALGEMKQLQMLSLAGSSLNWNSGVVFIWSLFTLRTLDVSRTTINPEELTFLLSSPSLRVVVAFGCPVLERITSVGGIAGSTVAQGSKVDFSPDRPRLLLSKRNDLGQSLRALQIAAHIQARGCSCHRDGFHGGKGHSLGSLGVSLGKVEERHHVPGAEEGGGGGGEGGGGGGGGDWEQERVVLGFAPLAPRPPRALAEGAVAARGGRREQRERGRERRGGVLGPAAAAIAAFAAASRRRRERLRLRLGEMQNLNPGRRQPQPQQEENRRVTRSQAQRAAGRAVAAAGEGRGAAPMAAAGAVGGAAEVEPMEGRRGYGEEVARAAAAAAGGEGGGAAGGVRRVVAIALAAEARTFGRMEGPPPGHTPPAHNNNNPFAVPAASPTPASPPLRSTTMGGLVRELLNGRTWPMSSSSPADNSRLAVNSIGACVPAANGCRTACDLARQLTWIRLAVARSLLRVSEMQQGRQRQYQLLHSHWLDDDFWTGQGPQVLSLMLQPQARAGDLLPCDSPLLGCDAKGSKGEGGSPSGREALCSEGWKLALLWEEEEMEEEVRELAARAAGTFLSSSRDWLQDSDGDEDMDEEEEEEDGDESEEDEWEWLRWRERERRAAGWRFDREGIFAMPVPRAIREPFFDGFLGGEMGAGVRRGGATAGERVSSGAEDCFVSLGRLRAFEEAGGVKRLVQMAAHGKDGERFEALKALSSLSSGVGASRIVLASAPTLPMLLLPLLASSSPTPPSSSSSSSSTSTSTSPNHRLVEAAAGTMRNLSEVPEHKEAIANQGALQVLVELCHRTSSRPFPLQTSVLTHVLRALGNFALDAKCAGTVISCGGCHALVRAMGEVSSPGVQEQAARVVSILASQGDAGSSCDALGQLPELFPALVRLLSSYSERVKQEAASAVWNLCLVERNRGGVAEAGGVRALVSLAETCANFGPYGTQEKVAGALWSLSVSEANCEAIGAAGGIAPLLRLAKSPYHEVKENAAGALWNLAFLPSNVYRFLSYNANNNDDDNGGAPAAPDEAPAPSAGALSILSSLCAVKYNRPLARFMAALALAYIMDGAASTATEGGHLLSALTSHFRTTVYASISSFIEDKCDAALVSNAAGMPVSAIPIPLSSSTPSSSSSRPSTRFSSSTKAKGAAAALIKLAETGTIKEAGLLRCSLAEISRFLTILRHPHPVLRSCAAFALLQFSAVGGRHTAHHVAHLEHLGGARILRAAAAAAQGPPQVTALCLAVLKNMQGFGSQKSNTVPPSTAL